MLTFHTMESRLEAGSPINSPYRRATMLKNTSKIQELNDSFRQTGVGGLVVITKGIQNLERPIIQQILFAVSAYKEFKPDNDPYGEHDFGSFVIGEYKIFWKIDYYDKEFQFGSEAPSNPDITKRVLTVMLAEEY